MNMKRNRIGRSAPLTVAMLVLSVLLLTCTMVLGIAADTTDEAAEKYSLTVQFNLYDDIGEEGRVGIKTELAAGEPINMEELIALYPDVAAILADFKLSDEGYVGMPEDGLMPASDLTIVADYAMEPFTISWVVDGEVITDTVKYGELPVYAGDEPTKAPDAEFTYTFAGWDAEIVQAYGDATYTAVFTATRNVYTVTFHYGDGKTESMTVEYGSAATAPTDVEKADTAEWDYTFIGWDVAYDYITGDTTVTAQYSQVKQTYTVTFNYGDGKTETVTVEYGSAATAPSNPDKSDTAEWDYTFTGWDKAFDNVTGNITVTAQYSQAKRTYTVTFNYGDGKTETVTVEYGASATAPTDTEKADTAEWDYTFTGWDKSFNNVTGNITVTAQYSQTKKSYTVTFNYGDGKTETVTVEYGASATAPTDTEKADTAEWDYTFKGWDKSFDNVTGDMTVTAEYDQVKRTYTVTFNYGDGKTETVTVEYGSAATAPTDTDKAATDEFTYTFTGWDKSFDNVTEDMTVTATYESVPVEVPTDTAEPDTTEPVETDTAEPDTDTDTDTTPVTTDPGTETDDTTAGGCEGSWWWIIVVIVVAAAIAAVVIVLLCRRNGTPDGDEPTEAPVEPTPEPETPAEPAAESAPLFVPLGEEIPEEETPAEIETVEEVSAETVDELMTDKVAEKLLEESEEEGGNGKMGIINVGVISAAYQAGDTVDLADLQAKGMIDGNVGRLKVLASGTLDKPLTIKADAFSVQAIKMITLTGGHAVKLNGDEK